MLFCEKEIEKAILYERVKEREKEIDKAVLYERVKERERDLKKVKITGYMGGGGRVRETERERESRDKALSPTEKGIIKFRLLVFQFNPLLQCEERAWRGRRDVTRTHVSNRYKLMRFFLLGLLHFFLCSLPPLFKPLTLSVLASPSH